MLVPAAVVNVCAYVPSSCSEKSRNSLFPSKRGEKKKQNAMHDDVTDSKLRIKHTERTDTHNAHIKGTYTKNKHRMINIG